MRPQSGRMRLRPQTAKGHNTMDKLHISSNPKELSTRVIKLLPQKRVQDILTKRFGLTGSGHTLEAIGKSYGITRERVRQIEEAALKNLRQGEAQTIVKPFAEQVRSHLHANGGVSEQKQFFQSLADDKYHPHLSFLLMIDGTMAYAAEDEKHHHRWAHGLTDLKKAEAVLHSFIKRVEQHGKPMKEGELYTLLEDSVREEGSTPDKKVLDSHLSVSKLIGKNPYGEFGLVSWPRISPRGVRDKAYLVLSRAGKPLHFREVADHINRVGWTKKKAHPQTVHNELIKDQRFVLVGRGLYGLKEWGYEAGTVKDVLVSILQQAQKPLTKEELMKRVLEKRVVKENTILLNLQDRKKFKRVEDAYTLV